MAFFVRSEIMAKYLLRFMLDYGSGTCIWSGNDEAREKYDYPVMFRELPVLDELKTDLRKFIKWYDSSLNRDDPGGDSLWSSEEWAYFHKMAKKMYARVCDELGHDYEVRNEYP